MKKYEILVQNKILTIFSYLVITILYIIQMFTFFKNNWIRNSYRISEVERPDSLAPKWEKIPTSCAERDLGGIWVQQ